MKRFQQKHTLFLIFVGMSGWLIPGVGHFILKEYKRAVIIFVTIILTFCLGLYIGSVGVVDPIGSWPWFIAQFMVSPTVSFIGEYTAAVGYPAYGKPNEIGQIYTSTAGLLNLLSIVNAVYIARMRWLKRGGANVA
ncbi:MAG: DUF6677 family protein [Planctomycetota bacterium]